MVFDDGRGHGFRLIDRIASKDESMMDWLLAGGDG
jgi:hypothetical protein